MYRSVAGVLRQCVAQLLVFGGVDPVGMIVDLHRDVCILVQLHSGARREKRRTDSWGPTAEEGNVAFYARVAVAGIAGPGILFHRFAIRIADR